VLYTGSEPFAFVYLEVPSYKPIKIYHC